MKKIFSFFNYLFIFFAIIFVFVAILPCQTSHALSVDDNVSYTSIEKIIKIDEHKCLDVVENVGVNFRKSGINVGLVRNISRINNVTRLVDGKKISKRTISKFELLSVTVDGQEEFCFVENDNEYFYINTGEDFHFKDAGDYVYQFHYKYDMGEDFIGSFDDFTFDIMDYDAGSDVENFSAQITFPKAFLNGKELDEILSFRTNDFAPVDFDAVNMNYDETTLTISCNMSGLSAGEGLTMQVILDEDYFDTSFEPGGFYIAWACVTFAIFALILILFGISKYRKNVVVVPEFYPPKDFSPIDVAKIYRGFVKKIDFVALIIYWAEKGLIKIENKGDDGFVLTKLRDFDLREGDGRLTDRKKEEKYFNSIFEHGAFETKNIPFSVKNKMAVTSRELSQTQTSTKQKVFKVLIAILSFVPYFMLFFWSTAMTRVNFSVLIAVFPLIAILVAVYYDDMPILFKAVWCAVFGGVPLVMFLTNIVLTYDIFGLVWLSILLLIVGNVIVRFVRIPVVKDEKLLGQVLGFKQFLLTCETERLQMLIDEQPEYFYNILPFCYVFGITKKVEKKFSALKCAKPTYMDGFSCYYFGNYFCRVFVLPIRVSSARSVGGFGTGFGGGFGGSSGGGGGGGGFHGR